MSIFWVPRVFEEVQSTQDHIKQAAREGAPEGDVVQGLVQTGGYGRHGRGWVSESGNLYMSLLLRPGCSAQDVTQLSFVAALAVHSAVEKATGRSELLTLKWPNDVLLDGKKCAGILLETEVDGSGRVEWLALGIGINVAHAPKDFGNALQGYGTGAAVELEAFRDQVLEAFGRLYALWQRKGFYPIRREWLDKTFETGTPVSFKIGNDPQSGIFEDLDETGNLIVRDTQSVLKTISAGEVHFGQ